MTYKIDKRIILEEARVIAKFNRDGSITKMDKVPNKTNSVFSEKRVKRNKQDIANAMVRQQQG